MAKDALATLPLKKDAVAAVLAKLAVVANDALATLPLKKDAVLANEADTAFNT